MKLRYLEGQCFQILCDSIGECKQLYFSEETNDWIKNLFNGRDYSKETNIDVELPTLDPSNGKDCENIIALHSALKDKITPQQATKGALWTHLSLFEFFDYTKERWLRKETTEETLKARIIGSKSKNDLETSRIGLLRNSISRLFWSGELSYCEDYEDPYTLTKILASHSDLIVQILDRNFAMNKNIVIGILQAIHTINEDSELQNVGSINGEYEWRELCKYLKRIGSVKMLDMLSKEEIKEMCYNFILKERGLI